MCINSTRVGPGGTCMHFRMCPFSHIRIPILYEGILRGFFYHEKREARFRGGFPTLGEDILIYT